MAVVVRPARPEEMGELGLIGAYVYAGVFGDGPENRTSTAISAEWTLCGFVDGQMAAMFSSIPFTMRAAGNAMSVGGISTVGTLPEFRRQGLLRKIMTEAFPMMREKGQSIGFLWASQAAIYQRYQFAKATAQRRYQIDTVDIGFHDGNMGRSTVERVDVANAYDTIKALYIEFVQDRMCYVHRAKQTWQLGMLEENAADGPVHIAISRGEDGTPNGYLIYTVRDGNTGRTSRNQIMKIRELVWLNDDAYRSLWRFIALHDLVGSVTWVNAPVDDPADELFVEPTLLHTRDGEGVWFRVIDAEAALAGRGYHAEGEVRIGIAPDDLAPWNTGTWHLEASSEGARVRKTNDAPDIELPAKSLASLFTGYRRARDLANWGLLEGDGQAIARADAIFATPTSPHCPDHF